MPGAPRLSSLLPDRGTMRVLSAATFIGTLGTGLSLAISVLFFTRVIGLSATQVGLGLSIAGAVGLAAGVPAGSLADRIGPRNLLVVLTIGVGVAETGYLLVHSFGWFLLVACLMTLLDSAARSVRSALIAGALDQTQRVRGRAYLRAVTNLGISVGTLFAALALHVGTARAYQTMIVLDAASFVLAGLLLSRVPAVAPVPHAGGSRLPALRDKAYLSLAGLNAVLSLHYSILEIAVPLWVVEHTSAPRSTVALLLLVNTVVCVLFQVRASRGSDDLGVAARVQRRAGGLLLVACALFGLARGLPAAGAVAILIAAALVHVTGELQQSAGSWGLGYGLAPAHAQGQYQGVYNTGMSVASTLAPVVLVTLGVNSGLIGWLALGLIFAAAGAAVPPTARWAERTRTSPTEAAAH